MPTLIKVGGNGMSLTPSSLHLKILCCAFAAALFSGQHATAQEETWIGPSDSLWSSGASWFDGTAPIVGGDPALTVRLGAGGTSMNDLAGSFALNHLVFSAKLGTMVSASADGSLNFVGIDPTISLEGIRDARITSPVLLNSTGTGLLIKGTGPQNLTLFNSITEGAQPQMITIDTKARSLKTGTVRLFQAISATGGITLKSGNLEIISSPAAITGPLNAHSGAITLTNDISNPIVLHGDITLRSPSYGPILSGVISGATPEAGLLIRSGYGVGSPMRFSGASTYTGATTIDYSNAPELAVMGGGRVNLAGPNGSILQTSEFNVRARSTLLLEALAAMDNRVGDSTPIHLRGSSLYYSQASGGTDLSRTEVTGPVDGAGFSTIGAFTDGTAGLRLQLASLTRTERGTFLFDGTGLGNDPTIGVGNIFIAAAPTDLLGGGGTGPKTSILPYAIGESGFVTYSAATGIRPLSWTEYRSTLASTAVDENVRLTSTQTLSTARTVNALILADGGVNINGTGTLTIASGAILQCVIGNSFTPSVISNPLAFGTTEANIFVTSRDLLLAGTISGANGLTKSGFGKLRLGASNSFTGPLTINAGTISFAIADQLGPDNSPIIINGHNAGLIYSGTSSLDFSRPIETRTGLARIEASGGGNFNITSRIGGAGGLQLVTSNNSTITLPSGSTYTGTTYVGDFDAAAPDISIPNDSAFGSGGAVHVDGGKIGLTGPWNSAREINFGSATLDTAGFDATLLGPLSAKSTFTITKTGAGRLKIADASQFNGTLAINAGTFEIAGYLSGSVSASSGTTVTGEGLIGDILNISGVLEPGGGVGEITAGTLQLGANSTLRLRLDSLAEYGRLVSANAPSLGSGITLELLFGPGFDPVEFVDQFTVIRNDSASPITMAVTDPFIFEGNPLSEGEQFAAGGTLWSISYQGGSGNDVVLSAVPEPASGVLLIAAVSVLGLNRRRRC